MKFETLETITEIMVEISTLIYFTTWALSMAIFKTSIINGILIGALTWLIWMGIALLLIKWNNKREWRSYHEKQP